MDRFIIEGGTPLRGAVTISGAKNAVLPIFAATLLAEGPCRVQNVPRLRDVVTMIKVLETFGLKASPIEGGEVVLDATGVNRFDAPYDLVKTMRASFVVLGPLLARFGRAHVSMPGGCAIGARQIDLHLKGLAALGATIDNSAGYIDARAEKLVGTTIVLDFPSVGATENIMMAAVLAQGRTVLEHAAQEPEIVDLAVFLSSMGARIEGAGTGIMTIDGVESLKGVTHRVIPDRIETGTFAIAAAITGGTLVLKKAAMGKIDAFRAKLIDSGVSWTTDGLDIIVCRGEHYSAVDITTQPHPGFPTDLQAPITALLTLARGTSTITEQIFENRFLHIPELNRMGASARIQSSSGAVVKGVEALSGAPVMASDLRAGAALVLAGLAASGQTEVSRVYHVDRGYEGMETKLEAVGARIKRVH